MRYRVLVGLFLAALCLIPAGCGGGRSVAGTYVSELNPDNRFELKGNGTFELYLTVLGIEMGDHGRYEVEGDTITFKFPDGTLLRAKLSDGTLMFPENSLLGFYGLTIWHKQGG